MIFIVKLISITSMRSSLWYGSSLLYLFFLFFKNDLSNNIKSSIRLFTDDQVLYLYIGTFILCKTVLFCRKILTVLPFGRPIGKWSLMLPNVTLWEWLGIIHTNSSRLHIAPANFGKCSVRKIYWHDNHREHGLGSTYLWYFIQSN